MQEAEQTLVVPTPVPTEPRLIKRYSNRKLYDTVESRYVTLEQLCEMIRAGTELKIVDNRTKEDLTTVTLAQIIFEQEKKKAQTPLTVLRDILVNGGGALTGFLQTRVEHVNQRVAALRDEAEELRAKLRIEERIRGAVDGIGALPSVAQELAALERRIEELEKAVRDSAA